jgi:NAD(P)H-dependent FMN reductase
MQRPVVLAVAAGTLLALLFHIRRRRPPADDPDEEVLTLGLVLGSERRGGNTIGMGAYLSALIPTLHPVVLDVVDLASLNLPRTFTHAPAKPRPPPTLLSQYFPSQDEVWSARVKSWDAVLFVAPEYNGHVPGLLKSALDRLYAEWNGVPAGLVAHGYEGGGRLLQNGTVLLAELGMEVVGGVGVSTGGRRVTGAEAWLEEVRGEVEVVVRGLVEAARRRQG